jgi:hypothetical protein
MLLNCCSGHTRIRPHPILHYTGLFMPTKTSPVEKSWRANWIVCLKSELKVIGFIFLRFDKKRALQIKAQHFRHI